MSIASGLGGRVALVTGASGGNAQSAERLAAEITGNGGRAVAIGADLRSPDAPTFADGVAGPAPAAAAQPAPPQSTLIGIVRSPVGVWIVS
jgi:hypothetical protein